MKIAFVGGRGFHSNYGGVENAVREITSRLARTSDADVEVDVYGQGTDPWFSIEEVSPGLNSISAPAFMSRFKGNAVLAFVNCLYALLVRRPQVLLLFASGPSLLAILAKILRVPVIGALRSIDSQREWSLVSKTVLRLGEFSAVRVADHCTVNSLEMYRYYDGASRGLIYIPNGATDASAGKDDVLASLGVERDGYILFAARLDPTKRLHLLLQAYQQVPKDCRLPLIVAGGQCRTKEYQDQLEALACEGVQFIGHAGKDVLDPLMRNCAMFVLPSIKEGMSNSLLAAMNRARCVVCADIDANADVVQHEFALYEADNVDALAARLTHFCNDPAQREACGQAMRQIVKRNFSWDATTESYRELIMHAARGTAPVTNA
jgi:glycosyltransferase involved in cell wall biosynthesis